MVKQFASLQLEYNLDVFYFMAFTNLLAVYLLQFYNPPYTWMLMYGGIILLYFVILIE